MKIGWLTNHLLVVGAFAVTELLLFAIVLALGAPIETAVRLAIHLLLWAQTAWIFAVAVELNIFNLKAWQSTIGWLASFGLLFSVASAFSEVSNSDSLAENEIARVVFVLGASVYVTLVACIADRISNSLFHRIGAFYGLINWPIFLFLLTSSIRVAAEKSEQVQA